MAAMQRRAAGTNSNLGSTFGPTKADEDVLERFPAGLRVLVVDDDTTCLKILEQMLQKCEYNGVFFFSSLCYFDSPGMTLQLFLPYERKIGSFGLCWELQDGSGFDVLYGI